MPTPRKRVRTKAPVKRKKKTKALTGLLPNAISTANGDSRPKSLRRFLTYLTDTPAKRTQRFRLDSRHSRYESAFGNSPLKSKAKTPTVKTTGRWEYHFERARVVAGALVLVLMGLWTTNAVLAASWVEPTQIPPGGNPPGFVWLQAEPPSILQVGGVNLDGLLRSLGGAMFGSGTLDLGVGAGGQNVIFGTAKYSGMHTNDALVLVQTANDQGTPTDRLRVTKDGNLIASGKITGTQLCIGGTCQANFGVALQNTTGTPQTGNFNVGGTGTVGELVVSGNGCFGPVFHGVAPTSTGIMGGYIGANAKCALAFTGSHLCSSDEVVRSINCGAFSRPGVSVGTGSFWVSSGPPGYTANSNDCSGWTSPLSSELGPYWLYDAPTGGKGFLTSCNVIKSLGCCR